MPDLYYCIPAYNEESNIANCLDSLNQQDHSLNLQTIICLNGCTDSTEEKVLESQQIYPRLNINVAYSKKGIAHAQNAIIKSIEDKKVPLFFLDADVVLKKDCTRILYEEIASIDDLIVVGTWPEPVNPGNLTLWQNILFNVLYMRAFHPKAEISVNDVSEFKKFALVRPQPKMDPKDEMRSKIYFHGRAFMIRNSEFFKIPEDDETADDTFLPNYIHTNFGQGTIRIRYDALVYYQPYPSLRKHYNAYRRVFWDLDNIDGKNEFEYSRKMEKTKLDWKYIISQGPGVTMKFITYAAIAHGEEAAYRILPKKTLSEVWKYDHK